MRFILIFLLVTISFSIQGQPNYERLYNKYDDYKEKTIVDRRFKHSLIESLLYHFEKNKLFSLKKMGKSIEGRSINLVSLGSGKINVLLWSQMHGNEPTSTMAIIDIFNFFNNSNEFDELKEMLLSKLTLHFIPMLNPDGAEKFRRRTALNVDLNRDALRQQNPEAIILKHVRDSLQADWGFNLHDQNPYYGAGITEYTASVSFLAPAYNYPKDVNEKRGDAMQLIVTMNNILQHYIPNKVGKYSDDFEPRAFGDNIQKWGTRTILIESGGLEGDLEKQRLRRLHFTMLISAFEAIANGEYQQETIKAYDRIPFNESNHFHDLIIRKANVPNNGKSYVLDIAFRNREIGYGDYRKFYNRSGISDIGDMHIVHGFKEWDASQYQVQLGKSYPKTCRKLKHLKKLDHIALLKQGYTDFRIKELLSGEKMAALPINLYSGDTDPDNRVGLGNNPSLLFKKNGEVKVVLINGLLYDLDADSNKIKSSIRNLQ